MTTLIINALIFNEAKREQKNLLLKDGLIDKIFEIAEPLPRADLTIDAQGLWLLPGIIDDQVHFREPGLTHKGNIFTESRAAAAGGVTSFMEMPNTSPACVSNDLLQKKFNVAEENSLVNYSFFLGAANDNIDQIISLNKREVAAVKMFLGSSTGNMLVDNKDTIREILSKSPIIVAAHCEDDSIIEVNLNHFKQIYGDDIPAKFHPEIRSAEACYSSSKMAKQIAEQTGGRLHIFHLSTAKEIELLSDNPLKEKKITAEVCVHHLWFNDTYYEKLGNNLKWNPAVKTENDRLALIEALKAGKIDIVATDHAPHLPEEKNNVYTKAPSGGPMVQHSLMIMLELAKQGNFEIEDVVKWMCHNPAELFDIDRRGFIRENYYADIVLVNPNKKTRVSKDNILYKCGWSPLEGQEFSHTVMTTFVNGQLVYNNGKIIESKAAMKLVFNRK